MLLRGLVASGLVLAVPACSLYSSTDDDDPVQPSEPDAAVVPGDTNILRNGDFEELDATGFAADWRNLDDNPGGTISIVTDPVFSGEHALQYAITAEGDGFEFFIIQDSIDPAELIPGERYELSGFYRLDQRGGEISFNYIVRAMPGDDIGNDWDNTHPATENTWEPFAWQFTIPGDASPANYSVYLHLIKWTSTDNTLWVDDVSLHPVN